MRPRGAASARLLPRLVPSLSAVDTAELKERSRLYGLGIAIVRASALRVPAFAGPLATRYAQVR